MSKDTAESKKLASLIKQLKSSYEPEEAPSRDPITQLVVAFLQWEYSRDEAEEALGRLMSELVDINELRVSLDSELIELIGEDYPLVEERVARLREALNEVFVREYAVEMKSIADKGKKEQRAYLDSLPGVPPYVAAQVMLLSFGGHAMPTDRKLVQLLAEEEILEEGTPPEQAESFLQRHIKADDAVQTHLLFQAWADEYETPDLEAVPTVVVPEQDEAEPEEQEPEVPAQSSSRKSTGKKKSTGGKPASKSTRRAKKK